MKHTPEPWATDFCEITSGETNIGWIEGAITTCDEDVFNAERIVACVNACAGIENPEDFLRNVRLYSHETVATLAKERDELRQQRDELMEAIKEALTTDNEDGGVSILADALIKIEATP